MADGQITRADIEKALAEFKDPETGRSALQQRADSRHRSERRCRLADAGTHDAFGSTCGTRRRPRWSRRCGRPFRSCRR